MGGEKIWEKGNEGEGAGGRWSEEEERTGRRDGEGREKGEERVWRGEIKNPGRVNFEVVSWPPFP